MLPEKMYQLDHILVRMSDGANCHYINNLRQRLQGYFGNDELKFQKAVKEAILFLKKEFIKRRKRAWIE